jgi:hypothetical protein
VASFRVQLLHWTSNLRVRRWVLLSTFSSMWTRCSLSVRSSIKLGMGPSLGVDHGKHCAWWTSRKETPTHKLQNLISQESCMTQCSEELTFPWVWTDLFLWMEWPVGMPYLLVHKSHLMLQIRIALLTRLGCTKPVPNDPNLLLGLFYQVRPKKLSFSSLGPVQWDSKSPPIQRLNMSSSIWFVYSVWPLVRMVWSTDTSQTYLLSWTLLLLFLL